MASQRDGGTIEIAWAHISLAHESTLQLLEEVQELISDHMPEVMMSVNRNVADTEALVKITSDRADFLAALISSFQPAIIRVFDATDHDEAIGLVNVEAWQGPGEA